MRISPRYESEHGPLIAVAGAPGAVGPPFLRQRRRLAATLRALTPEQWAAPSRCEGWRVQDVVAHLVGVDRYWKLSVSAGVAGEPTRVLASFDPKATPASMVDAVRHEPAEATRDQYLEACEALCQTVEDLDDHGWRAVAESPAGHVGMGAVVHHALWDCWVHERDILVPLGLDQAREDDEVLACVRYAAALGPALALQAAPAPAPTTLVVETTDPRATVTVAVTDRVRVGDDGAGGEGPDGERGPAVRLAGDAVALADALSMRAPLPAPLPAEHEWLLAGLGRAFETAAT